MIVRRGSAWCSHETICLWWLKQGLRKTLKQCPDLRETYDLSAKKAKFLEKVKAEPTHLDNDLNWVGNLLFYP